MENLFLSCHGENSTRMCAALVFRKPAAFCSAACQSGSMLYLPILPQQPICRDQRIKNGPHLQDPHLAQRAFPSLEELELLALEAYAHLPEEFRKLTGEIVIQVAEFPTDEIMDDLSLETPFDLLGLFEGRGIAERWNPATGEGPNRITLYRRAILDYWAENEETMGDIVTHVLIHEIGHHFGLSDDDMERIEASAE